MGPLLYLAMSAKTSHEAGFPLPSQYSSLPASAAVDDGAECGVDVFSAGQIGELTCYVPLVNNSSMLVLSLILGSGDGV